MDTEMEVEQEQAEPLPQVDLNVKIRCVPMFPCTLCFVCLFVCLFVCFPWPAKGHHCHGGFFLKVTLILLMSSRKTPVVRGAQRDAALKYDDEMQLCNHD